MTVLHGVSFSLLGIIALLGFALVESKQAFAYGILVSFVNAVLYYGFYWRHRRRIATYPEQALVVVVSSTVTRFALVGCSLILGWVNLQLQPESLILGFVLGQIFYLLNQLITVKTSHGK